MKDEDAIARANVEDALADEECVRYYEWTTRVLVQAVHEDRVYVRVHLPRSELPLLHPGFHRSGITNLMYL